GGVWVATTGAGVVATGVVVGFGVGGGGDDDSGPEIAGAPPPTPPLPRARLVAFVGDVGVCAAAQAQVEIKTMATMPHPITATGLNGEPSNGRRERRFQPLAASPTRRSATPKK